MSLGASATGVIKYCVGAVSPSSRVGAIGESPIIQSDSIL